MSEELTAEDRWLCPAGFDQILRCVSSGGDIIDFCDDHDLSYADVMSYIYASPKFKRAYDMALEEKKAYTVQRVIGELEKIATADIGNAFDDDGKPIPIHELPPRVRKSLQAVEVVKAKNGKMTYKIKGWDKLKGLELLGKHFGIFKEVVEHRGATLEELLGDVEKMEMVDADYTVRSAGDEPRIVGNGKLTKAQIRAGVSFIGRGNETRTLGEKAEGDTGGEQGNPEAREEDERGDNESAGGGGEAQ